MTTHPPLPESRFSFFTRLWWALFSHNLRERDSDVFRVDRLQDFLLVHKPPELLNSIDRRSLAKNFEDDTQLRDKVPSKRGGERDRMVKDVSERFNSDSDDSDSDDGEHPHLVLGVDDMGLPDASQTAAEVAHEAIKEKGQIPIWLLKERLMTSGLRSLLVSILV
jgi:hypothetical protein